MYSSIFDFYFIHMKIHLINNNNRSLSSHHCSFQACINFVHPSFLRIWTFQLKKFFFQIKVLYAPLIFIRKHFLSSHYQGSYICKLINCKILCLITKIPTMNFILTTINLHSKYFSSNK